MELASAEQQQRVRLHPVVGAYNLRDTGGYTAAAGFTRWGKLYRSDALHQLEDDGRERLATLRVGLVIDLRDDAELEHAPSALDGLDLVVRHLPIFQGASPELIGTSGITLSSLYRTIIEEFGANLARAVRAIAGSGDTPVLVHCTAGKDRTGLVIALALLAVGVDRASVVTDYAQTEVNLRGVWSATMLARIIAEAGMISPDLEEIVTASPAAVLEEIIDRIERDYGSAGEYLIANGMTAEELVLLREAIIETPTTSHPRKTDQVKEVTK